MDRRHEARELQDQGLTIKAIAERLALPPTTVANWLPTEHDRSQFDRWMTMRLEEGLSNQQIADAVGVNRQRVAAVLGPVPRRRTRGRRRAMNLSDRTWEGAREAARRLGLRAVQGNAEGIGSVGMLLDAIAAGEVELRWKAGHGPHDPLGGVR